MTAVQGSLLDFGVEPGLSPLDDASIERRILGSGAWVDLRRAWLTGAGGLFDRLVDTVDWHSERRRMYDRVVDVPRLVRFYGEGEAFPDPLLREAMTALDGRYRREDPFCTVGLCLYRDGRDSVAWHGDTVGRGRYEDTRVAILSLGATRALALRPRGGGHSHRFELAPGDLLVMGGSAQRTWEHAVPKTSRPIGPRISVQFRPRDVR